MVLSRAPVIPVSTLRFYPTNSFKLCPTALSFRKLYLYSNRISGAIPSTISALTKMMYVDCVFVAARPSGMVPARSCRAGAARTILNSSCQVRDLIINCPVTCFTHRTIGMSGNQINSTIPDGITKLTRLEYVQLADGPGHLRLPLLVPRHTIGLCSLPISLRFHCIALLCFLHVST
jgi:hypothetical protein